jgi:hypothetical protein
MSIKEALEPFIGKDINVMMTGANGPMPGKLIDVVNDWFIMKTKWADAHYFDMTKTVSFWVDKEVSASNARMA